MVFVIVPDRNPGNKHLGNSYVILQTMSLFKRYRFFLVAALLVAAFSLLILFRYSTIAKVHVKLTGSAELGLKYLNDLKDKLSHEAKGRRSGNKHLDSAGKKDEKGLKNVVSTSNSVDNINDDNTDQLVARSLENNSKEKPDVPVEKDDDLKTEATLKSITETVKDVVENTKTVPSALQTSTELSTTTRLATIPTSLSPTREKEVESHKEDNTEDKSGETDGLELCPKKPTNLGK